MRFFNQITALAILAAGPLRLVLAAQTVEQITVNIQNAQTAITDAEDNAKNVNNAAEGALDYKAIVNNNNNIANTIRGYDSALEGTQPFSTEAQQQEILEATTPFSDAVANYYDTLANKVSDFVLSEKDAIQESVDALQNEIDQFYKDLEALGPLVAAAIEAQASDDDQAREDLDDDYEDALVG